MKTAVELQINLSDVESCSEELCNQDKPAMSKKTLGVVV
jgi:hypothetical protein